MKPTDHDPKKASARGPNFPYADPSSGSGSSRASSRDDPYHNEDVAHEQSDINVRAVIMSAIVVAVVCMVTAGLMYGLMGILERQAKARDPKLSPLSMPATNMPPTTLTSPKFGSAPEPRLMTNEPVNLQQVRDQQRQQLSAYGWVDEKSGIARIPIDEAKTLVLERLPVRPVPVEDPRFGTRVPASGESTSGRAITKPVSEAAPAAPAAPAPAHKDH